MEYMIVRGPCQLDGEVRISASKNACLPLMAAVLLNKNPVHFKGLPPLQDIQIMKEILKALGVKIQVKGEVSSFDASDLTSCHATSDLVKKMRASILILGPLLARMCRAEIFHPGGCAIGSRPIDIHLSGLQKLGAHFDLRGDCISGTCKRLKGTSITLRYPSVGATENIVMAASLSEGQTVIDNVAKEPEVVDLIHFLNQAGAKIRGIGTKRLIVDGVKELKTVTYKPIGDRIEAMTYLIAALATRSHIMINNIDSKHVEYILEFLESIGAYLQISKNSLEVFPSELHPFKIVTSPYPGFPTDMQAQIITLACTIKGTSTVTENIFENRFMHVEELIKLGAMITLKGNTAVINGGKKMISASLICTDLRASAALIIASLFVTGDTQIHKIYHLDRGYEKLEEKFSQLGVNIERRI